MSNYFSNLNELLRLLDAAIEVRLQDQASLLALSRRIEAADIQIFDRYGETELTDDKLAQDSLSHLQEFKDFLKRNRTDPDRWNIVEGTTALVERWEQLVRPTVAGAADACWMPDSSRGHPLRGVVGPWPHHVTRARQTQSGPDEPGARPPVPRTR